MPIVNIPLTTSIKQRTNNVDKDAKMVNCYKETFPDGRTMAVKRPGKATYTVTPALQLLALLYIVLPVVPQLV